MSNVPSIALAAVTSQQAQTAQTLQAVFTKQAAQQDQALAALLQQSVDTLKAAESAPPPGTGLSVDITA